MVLTKGLCRQERKFIPVYVLLPVKMSHCFLQREELDVFNLPSRSLLVTWRDGAKTETQLQFLSLENWAFGYGSRSAVVSWSLYFWAHA